MAGLVPGHPRLCSTSKRYRDATNRVMAALGAAIHAFAPLRRGKTWMAGTSPAMTKVERLADHTIRCLTGPLHHSANDAFAIRRFKEEERRASRRTPQSTTASDLMFRAGREETYILSVSNMRRTSSTSSRSLSISLAIRFEKESCLLARSSSSSSFSKIASSSDVIFSLKSNFKDFQSSERNYVAQQAHRNQTIPVAHHQKLRRDNHRKHP
jgi:hypothetical protein